MSSCRPRLRSHSAPPSTAKTRAKAAPGVRTYVLDTSVLLADPGALKRFAEHEVVLPVVVITELEGKRHHPELGFFARSALRALDELRILHGRLDEPVPVGDEGGTVRVELNHTDPDRRCPRASGSATTTPGSSRWPATSPTRASTSRWSPRTCRCGSRRPRSGSTPRSTARRRSATPTPATPAWPSSRSPPADLDELYDDGVLDLEAARQLPCHQGLVLLSDRGTALGRVGPDKQVHLVRGDREAFGIHGRSAEQRIALEMLLDPEVGIVSLGGRAGTGKSAMALCAGLEAVMERGQHKKVVVFRPLFAVGGQELGYLPGSESEKMSPWGQAVFDTLGAMTSKEVIDEILDRGMLEVLPLTHIRGRSLHDAFVIVDEAQSLERNVLLTVLSRIGANSKVVLTHDVAQRDNLRVGRHDGVVAVIEKLKGHPLFAHVTLTRSERSPIAALVTEMLENVTL